MNRRISTLVIAVVFLFMTSCSKKAVGGVESSMSETGAIQRVKLTSDNVDFRAGCSNNTAVLHNSNKNSTYDVVNPVADWYAVNLPTNQIGFVPKSQCTPVVVDDKKPDATNTTPKGTSSPQGVTSPKTPSSQTNSNSLSADEQEMVRLVNEARAQNNLAPLKVDTQLANVARIKAQDMIDNKYFSHYSPKYGSPFDMMKAFSIAYVQAGENIAGNQSVSNAENSLMNSPGHRANILNPNYTHIGIGIRNGGTYGKMFSQMFISKPQ
jgi:uncharacterized YkwD family protein